MSLIKKVLLSLFLITALLMTGVIIYSENHTLPNDEELSGNTAGNIYNGGLFCEKNGKIYFSNDNDNGSLYMMNSDATEVKKLSDDKAAYINVDENYIYYIRAVNTKENDSESCLPFNNTGIYRITRNGKKLKLMSGNPGGCIMLKGNYIYYLNYDLKNGLNLYRRQNDGSMERLLHKGAAVPAAVINNVLYYTETDSGIDYLDLSSFTTGTCIRGNFSSPVFFGDYIYYIDPAANTINRINTDGTGKTVLVSDPCLTFNITNSGKYLYYQVDNGDNSRICRMNLETSEVEVLLDGHYKQIHVTDNYVFFKDRDNTITYVLPADGSPKLSTFNPPVSSNN